MQWVKKHPFLALILLSLILRFSLLFLDYSFDVNNHMVWAKDALTRGVRGFYEIQSSQGFATHYPNYPPLAIVIFSFVYPLQSFIFKLVWWFNVTFPIFPSKLTLFVESRVFLAGLLKLPSIAADVGIALLLMEFARKMVPKEKKLPFITASLFLFNPAIFYNSAFWGQIDAVPIFFALLSFYLLFFTKHSILSALTFTLGILVKPTIFLYLPIYVIYLVWKHKLIDSLKALGTSLLVFWLVFLPFYQSGNILLYPFTTYYKSILLTQSIPFATNGAFNFWLLLTQFKGIKDTTVFLLGMSYRVWGYILTGAIFTLLASHAIKKKERATAFLCATFLLSLAGFLFLTKMHERYLMLPLPFLLLLSLKQKVYLRGFILLSIIGFLNLYHSWPVPRSEILIQLLDTPVIYSLLSLGNIGLFFYFLKRFISKT